jgi:hypothetical protein
LGDVPNREYRVDFANGEREFTDSLDKARDIVKNRTEGNDAKPGLLPAEVWALGTSAGELIETYGD